MMRVLFISAGVSVLALISLITGWGWDIARDAMRDGNRFFLAKEYRAALEEYEEGLSAAPENMALNFNAAQAAYFLSEYDKALGYYENAEKTVEGFLNAGNIYFNMGENEEEQKAQYYAAAMEIYKEGIKSFPENIPLKYNYELAREKLEQQEEKGNNGESEDSKEDNSQDTQDGTGENDNSANDEEQDESKEESEAEESENSNNPKEESNEESDTGNASEDGESEPDSTQNSEEAAIDQETIERIMQMLERQEEESLKNNQEMMDGKEGKNGW